MKTKPIQRSLSLLSALAMLLTVFAVPASAAARAQADVLTDDLVASGQRQFQVQVTNRPPDLAGLAVPASLDAVVLSFPVGVIDPVAAVSDDGRWNSFVDADLGLIFFTATEGNAIPFGESETFTMSVDVAEVADDLTETIGVQVSSDGGRTTKSASGDLDTVLRILGVTGVTVVKPATATNTDATQVTADQDTASIQAVIENTGSAARTVSVQAARKSGSSSITSPSRDVTVASGGTETVQLPATFGTAGDLVVEVSAASANSTAAPASSPPLTVQQAVSATYTNNSLSPRTVVPGRDVAFLASITKTGEPSLDVDTAASNLSFADEAFSAPLASPEDIGGGDQSAALQFASTTVSESISDGDYTPAIRLVGTDGNGASVNVPVAVSNAIKLDRALPVVLPSIGGASSRLSDAEVAVTNGTKLSFSGKIFTDGSQSAQCGTCSIVSANIVELGEHGTQVASQPVEVRNNGGNLEGTATLTYNAATRDIRLDVVVAKITLLQGTGSSSLVAVDTIAPFVTGATTGRDADGDFVAVDLNELIGAPLMSATDWHVDDNQVAAARAIPNPVTGATTVQLRLARPLTHDNVQPGVRYEPTDANRAYDRVDLRLANQALNAADGVVPEIPTVATVAGKGKQDGAFWTNDSTPDVEISNLVQGDTAELYIDRNGDGAVDAGDTFVGEGVSDSGEPVIITTAPLGSTDVALALLARVQDGGGNSSPVRAETLNLDFTSPTATIAEVTGNTVAVTFDEPLATGRNHTFDWALEITKNGSTRNRLPADVTGSDATRDLTVDETYYDPAADTLSRAFYRSRSTDGRYFDRAGNALADFEITVTQVAS